MAGKIPHGSTADTQRLTAIPEPWGRGTPAAQHQDGAGTSAEADHTFAPARWRRAAGHPRGGHCCLARSGCPPGRTASGYTKHSKPKLGFAGIGSRTAAVLEISGV